MSVKEHKAQSAERRGTWDKAWRKPVSGFQETPHTEVTQKALTTPALNCDSTDEVSSPGGLTRDLGAQVSTGGQSHRELYLLRAKPRNRRRKACVLSHSAGFCLGLGSHSYHRKAGPLPKSSFLGASQRPALQVSFSKDTNLWPVMLNSSLCFLHPNL